MPWEVRPRDGKFCVVKIADGSVVACHATSDKANAQVRALYASEANAALDALATFTRESDVNIPVGGGHNLRDYWVRGEGAAKIRWNTEGDGTRCIKHLRKYVRDPGGLCQEYHRMATGKSMHPHPGRLTEAEEMEEFHGHHDERAHGNWAHPGKFLEGGKSVADKAKSVVQDVADADKAAVGHHARGLHALVDKHGNSASTRLKLRSRLSNLENHELGQLAKHMKLGLVGRVTDHSREETINGIVRHVTKNKSRSPNMGGEMNEFADAPAEPYGDVTYADPGYRGRKRYPIDTPKHVRAAWAYINMPKNAAKYSADQLRSIKAKIQKAMSGIGAEVAADDELVTAAGCPPGHHKMPDSSCMADDDMQDYAVHVDDEGDDATPDEPWEGPLVVEDVESGDGRMFSAGSLDWADLPQPLMYQPANVGGHNGSIMVGEIQHMRRKGAVIHGRGRIFGHIVDGEHGDDVLQMVRTGGVSVDVDSVKNADVEMIYAADDKEGFFSKPEMTVYHRGRIRGATLVAFPAFADMKLQLLNDQLTASGGGDCDCEDRYVEPIVAAAHAITIPDLPPRGWFDEPTDVELSGALTITDEGRVYGILAPGGTRHRNHDVTVPFHNVDYTRFHKGETIVDGGGRVVTGVITADCGHAPTQNYGTLQARMDHYDNSCSVLANVRVGESAKGYVWVAGALNLGAQPHQVAQALGCALSGDWQGHPDRPGVREFIAAHLVPVPGFPLARTKASVTLEDGVVTASWLPVRHEPTRELAAINDAKAELARRFGVDPASRKSRIYAKSRKVRATCALADIAALR